MNTQTARTNASRLAPPTRGFTLIEMLVVIAILAILIAIVLPVMGSARTAAKKADTRVLFSNLAQATAAFQIDQRRLPGYFSPRQMGDVQNATRGLTTMDNILFDLVGGTTTLPAAGTTIITVGPTSTNQVTIDVAAMGATTQNKNGSVSKSYLTMDAKRYVPQTDPGARNCTAATQHAYLPTLVDSFGTPILAWEGDDVPSAGAFADVDVAAAAGTNGARYYRAQNAGFLDSTALGKLKEDQRSDTITKRGSALCLTAAINPSGTAVTRVQSQSTMEALLGNASQPDPAAPAGTFRPLSARAPIVFHSAGPDGVYVGIKDKGARSGVVNYAANQDPFGGALFDDIIFNAGN